VLDATTGIGVFVKLKLAICARAGNRAGLLCEVRGGPTIVATPLVGAHSLHPQGGHQGPTHDDCRFY
jgi:hypothetical protein